jgi:hypothetical protein
MSITEPIDILAKEIINPGFDAKSPGLSGSLNGYQNISVIQESGQQSQNCSKQKKKPIKKFRGDKAYSNSLVTTKKVRRTAKLSPKSSTLNSKLSYFPSLKMNGRANNSPIMKNSENTQRSVIESETRIFTNEFSPTSQLGTTSSFF